MDLMTSRRGRTIHITWDPDPDAQRWVIWLQTGTMIPDRVILAVVTAPVWDVEIPPGASWTIRVQAEYATQNGPLSEPIVLHTP